MTAAWDKEKSLGANVDAMKNAGLTWRAIAEAANANGHEMPWPDGGKLLRARKQFVAGTEGQEPSRSPRRSKVDKEAANPTKGKQWEPPWTEETTEEELIAIFAGKKITYTNNLTGNFHTTRVPRESKHTKIGYGKSGAYIEFASVEGPFQAIGLSRVIKLS